MDIRLSVQSGNGTVPIRFNSNISDDQLLLIIREAFATLERAK